MKTYSGVRLDKVGHVAELMLPFNGLNTAPMANKDTGTDWGSGLNGLRFVQVERRRHDFKHTDHKHTPERGGGGG